jgi:hypothetical protein
MPAGAWSVQTENRAIKVGEKSGGPSKRRKDTAKGLGKNRKFAAMATTDITAKNYRRLTLRVRLDGFSFAVTDTINGTVLALKEVDFSGFPRASKVEDHYWKAFVDNIELTRPYDEVTVIHDNNLNTFVPDALFDEAYLGSYLQYNTKVFETDFFEFDSLPEQSMKNVYIPYVNINNFLLDQFGPFTYRNTASILVPRLLELSKNLDSRRVFAHFSKSRFELVVAQGPKLLLFNSFDYQTPEDFLYYLLFTAEQLELNPEHFKLLLLGDISEDGDLFRLAYKYVRHVELAEVGQLKKRNHLSEAENRRHFILLQP